MSKQRIAELEAEIARLRERIAALEARPLAPAVIPAVPPYGNDWWSPPTRYPIVYGTGTGDSRPAPYTINVVAS
jgi:hypothetical protein